MQNHSTPGPLTLNWADPWKKNHSVSIGLDFPKSLPQTMGTAAVPLGSANNGSQRCRGASDLCALSHYRNEERPKTPWMWQNPHSSHIALLETNSQMPAGLSFSIIPLTAVQKFWVSLLTSLLESKREQQQRPLTDNHTTGWKWGFWVRTVPSQGWYYQCCSVCFYYKD